MSIEKRMNAAKANAIDGLAEIIDGEAGYSGDNGIDYATRIVEAIMEAAAGRVFSELSTESRRRSLADLEADLCGSCLDLLAPVIGCPGEGPAIADLEDLEDQALFQAWSIRVADLEGTEPEDGPRMSLVEELHADRSDRHPIGIAQELGRVIDALVAQDDEDAGAILDELAAALVEAVELVEAMARAEAEE